MSPKLSTILIISLFLLFAPSNFLWAQEWNPIDDYFFQYNEPEITLKTGSLKLYWSANTYTPYGYRGRKLPTMESSITVSSLLEILGENPKNLQYSWFLDGIFQRTKSGYGRDSFEFWVQRFAGDSHSVLLKAFNESRSFQVEKTITIPIFRPELVIYGEQNNQINLPYATAIEDSVEIFTEEENSFLALPYFFDIKFLRNLEFKWIFSNKLYDEPSLIANIFGLKITDKKTGGSLEQILKVVAANLRRPGQRAEKSIKMTIY